MTKVSIIIPVYNTGEILRGTIDSVLSQTYRNFELLLIDDGSTDESGKICDEYMFLDERVKVFHEENGGVCRARNIGIDNSTGEYITFCDHDDTYDPDLLRTEMQYAFRENADIVIVGAKHYNDETNKTIVIAKSMYFSGKEEIRRNFNEIMSSGVLGTIWNILYKKSTIGDVRFQEEYKKGHEDINFNMDIIKRVNIIRSTNVVLYNHIIRKSMSTSARIHKESLPAIKAINDKVAQYLEEDTKAIENDLSKYMEFQGRFMRLYSLYCVLTRMKKTEFKKNMDSLQYYSVRKKMRIKMNKNYMVFWMINNKLYSALYYFLRLYSKIFKRKTVIS